MNEAKPIGAVTSTVEPPNTTYVWAFLKLEKLDSVSKWDLVVIEDARVKGLRFVGQVVEMNNASAVLSSPITRKELLEKGLTPEDYVKGALNRPEFFTAQAKIKLMYQVGEGGEIGSVSKPPSDGSLIFRSNTDTASKVLGFEPQSSNNAICLGTLFSDSSIEACLNMNRMLGGHVAVFGQTWSGKSYAVGVLVEEAVSRGVPIVVFDHMGDYLDLDKGVDDKPSGINVIRVSLSNSGSGYVKISIDPEDLIGEPRILQTLGITDAQLNLLREAYEEIINRQRLRGVQALQALLRDVNTKKGPRPQLYVIGRMRGYSTATIDGLRWKISTLLSKDILGQGYDVSKLIRRGAVTVIDLSDVEEGSVRTLLVANMLSKIVQARKKNLIPPVAVVLEEAHNYVSTDETPSSVLVRDLIRGARHIGVGVILVSQRPAGIHRDAINVANTHIIFRLKGTDLEYVKQFAPLTREELEDIPLLPEGVAYITGPIIRGGHAVKVRVRKRKTVHRGQSISFVETKETIRDVKEGSEEKAPAPISKDLRRYVTKP